jgi:ribosome-binding protein aMBF1 (putative translation factor)
MAIVRLTIRLHGERFVILPEAEFTRLTGEPLEPELPPAAEDGNYPAVETMRAIMARDIIRARRALGWSQADLTRRARVRQATLNGIEQATHSASIKTFDKIHAALEAGDAEAARRKPKSVKLKVN